MRRRTGRHRARVVLLALLAFATAGCSMAIPSWVPLFGRPAPPAPAAEAPRPPASAPILTSRDQIESSPTRPSQNAAVPFNKSPCLGANPTVIGPSRRRTTCM